MQKKINLYFISGFPDFINGFCQHSIIKKAIEKQILVLHNINLRDFGIGKQQQIDDYQFGPGAGMVLKPEPVYAALQTIIKQLPADAITMKILLSPQGKVFDQNFAQQLVVKYDHVILLSGHYEGFDERIRQWFDWEISIGDYVLTNGEIAAMVVADAIVRLKPGVINPTSLTNESFNQNLLDHPVYTKPVIFRAKKVPAILLSGHHQKIANWRHKHAFLKTFAKRPDLLSKRTLTIDEKTWLKELKLPK